MLAVSIFKSDDEMQLPKLGGYSEYSLIDRSVGCILYTLLVGKPPFETQTLKDTYARIKKNEYHVPSRIGPLAKKLIVKLLQASLMLFRRK